MYGYEDQWAVMMFNEWGADSVKVDHMCNVADGDAPGGVEGCQTAPGMLYIYIYFIISFNTAPQTATATAITASPLFLSPRNAAVSQHNAHHAP